MSTVYEESAREKKCLSVARFILDEAVKIVAAQTDDEWQLIAKNAGVNVPSEESRLKIVQLLKGARLG